MAEYRIWFELIPFALCGLAWSGTETERDLTSGAESR